MCPKSLIDIWLNLCVVERVGHTPISSSMPISVLRAFLRFRKIPGTRTRNVDMVQKAPVVW